MISLVDLWVFIDDGKGFTTAISPTAKGYWIKVLYAINVGSLGLLGVEPGQTEARTKSL